MRRLVTGEMRWIIRSLRKPLLLINWEHRFLFMALLVERPRNVTELAAAVGVDRSIPSRHMATMLRDGLATCETRGKQKFYSLAPTVRVDINTQGVQLYLPGPMGTGVTLWAPITLLKYMTGAGPAAAEKPTPDPPTPQPTMPAPQAVNAPPQVRVVIKPLGVQPPQGRAKE